VRCTRLYARATTNARQCFGRSIHLGDAEQGMTLIEQHLAWQIRLFYYIAVNDEQATHTAAHKALC
jgi:hypothetical protein